MSITSIKERIGTRTGDEEKQNSSRSRRYSREFVIVTSSAEGAATILEDERIPRLGTPYACERDFDDTCLVVRRSVKQENRTATLWTATVEYSTDASEQEDPNPDDPLLEPPELEWSYETVQEPLRIWKSESVGKEFEGAVNSAGEPFINPPILQDVPILVLRVAVNRKRFDPVANTDLHGSVNDAVWLGFERGAVLLSGIGSRLMQKKGQIYSRVAYTFKFRREGWQTVVLDQGSYYLDEDKFKHDFLTVGGQPTIGNLDGNGAKLAAEAAVIAVFLTFETRPYRNFNQLNLV